MRHQLSGRQLSRNAPHRSAMFRNMATSLLRHETIRTTLPKAKELRRVVEPLITLGKVDTDSNRRRAFAQLRDADVVVKLFESLSPRFMTRPGGYTRILRMDPRPGDAAPMALVQLLDQPEAAVEADEEGDDATPKAPKKKAAARKTSPRKRAVKTDEQRAEKKAKSEAKAASDVKKAEVKATAKASKKTAPKKKASAKKKSAK